MIMINCSVCKKSLMMTVFHRREENCGPAGRTLGLYCQPCMAKLIKGDIEE